MKNSFTLTKERIILLIAGIIVLTAGGIYRFLPDLKEVPVTDRISRIKKYQDKVAGLPALEDRILFLTSHVERMAGSLISASSVELAGAEIQKLLRDKAGSEKIAFRSIKTLKPDTKSYTTISVIPVNLVFQAQIRQLKDFIYRIESSGKFMAVSELRIIRPAKDDTDLLNIIMTVQGFLNKEG